MFPSCMDSVLAAETDTEIYQLVANKYSRLQWPKFPWYELACLLVNSSCEDAQLEYGFDGFIIAHFPRDSDGEIEREKE